MLYSSSAALSTADFSDSEDDFDMVPSGWQPSGVHRAAPVNNSQHFQQALTSFSFDWKIFLNKYLGGALSIRESVQRDTQYVFLLGLTRIGKTVLYHYLKGESFKIAKQHRHGYSVPDTSKFSTVGLSKVGHSYHSETLLPHFSGQFCQDFPNIEMVDLAGLLDRGDVSRSLAITVAMRSLLSSITQSPFILLLIQHDDIDPAKLNTPLYNVAQALSPLLTLIKKGAFDLSRIFCFVNRTTDGVDVISKDIINCLEGMKTPPGTDNGMQHMAMENFADLLQLLHDLCEKKQLHVLDIFSPESRTKFFDYLGKVYRADKNPEFNLYSPVDRDLVFFAPQNRAFSKVVELSSRCVDVLSEQHDKLLLTRQEHSKILACQRNAREELLSLMERQRLLNQAKNGNSDIPVDDIRKNIRQYQEQLANEWRIVPMSDFEHHSTEEGDALLYISKSSDQSLHYRLKNGQRNFLKFSQGGIIGKIQREDLHGVSDEQFSLLSNTNIHSFESIRSHILKVTTDRGETPSRLTLEQQIDQLEQKRTDSKKELDRLDSNEWTGEGHFIEIDKQPSFWGRLWRSIISEDISFSNKTPFLEVEYKTSHGKFNEDKQATKPEEGTLSCIFQSSKGKAAKGKYRIHRAMNVVHKDQIDTLSKKLKTIQNQLDRLNEKKKFLLKKISEFQALENLVVVVGKFKVADKLANFKLALKRVRQDINVSDRKLRALSKKIALDETSVLRHYDLFRYFVELIKLGFFHFSRNKMEANFIAKVTGGYYQFVQDTPSSELFSESSDRIVTLICPVEGGFNVYQPSHRQPKLIDNSCHCEILSEYLSKQGSERPYLMNIDIYQILTSHYLLNYSAVFLRLNHLKLVTKHSLSSKKYHSAVDHQESADLKKIRSVKIILVQFKEKLHALAVKDKSKCPNISIDISLSHVSQALAGSISLLDASLSERGEYADEVVAASAAEFSSPVAQVELSDQDEGDNDLPPLFCDSESEKLDI